MNKQANTSNKDEIDLKEVFKIIAKRKWWLVATIIFVMILGFIYTFLQPLNYKAVYQIDLEEVYINSDLTEKYPGSELTLNYFNSDNTPSTFMSTNIFESLKDLSPQIDYAKLLSSGDVSIEKSSKANIFKVGVSHPDSGLANEIALILIDSYDNYIRSENKEALNQITNQIEADIEVLEYENQTLDEMISNLKIDIDTLYVKLYDYIIEYNNNLVTKLEEDKVSTLYYNIVIPPNKIEDEITFIKEEISIYNIKVADNNSEINNLNGLRQNLIKSEEIIIDRINLLSENPIYRVDNRRIRNITVFLFLSVVMGIIIVFLANFFINIKDKKNF